MSACPTPSTRPQDSQYIHQGSTTSTSRPAHGRTAQSRTARHRRRRRPASAPAPRRTCKASAQREHTCRDKHRRVSVAWYRLPQLALATRTPAARVPACVMQAHLSGAAASLVCKYLQVNPQSSSPAPDCPASAAAKPDSTHTAGAQSPHRAAWCCAGSSLQRGGRQRARLELQHARVAFVLCSNCTAWA